MPRINVHLDDVESAFETFPEGSYVVAIQPSSKVKQSESGAYIQFISKCVEGEMEEKMIGWNCSLLPQALWNIKALVEAAGVEWDEDGFELDDLFEQQVIIDVSTRDYDNPKTGKVEQRNQVDGYHAV